MSFHTSVVRNMVCDFVCVRVKKSDRVSEAAFRDICVLGMS